LNLKILGVSGPENDIRNQVDPLEASNAGGPNPPDWQSASHIRARAGNRRQDKGE